MYSYKIDPNLATFLRMFEPFQLINADNKTATATLQMFRQFHPEMLDFNFRLPSEIRKMAVETLAKNNSFVLIAQLFVSVKLTVLVQNLINIVFTKVNRNP